jgi:hypothetical protein
MLRVTRMTHELTRCKRLVQCLAAIGAALQMQLERRVRLDANIAIAQSVLKARLIFRAPEPSIRP